MVAMADICEECPVRLHCANYAVNTNNGRGVDGGFYAGHWIPWKNHGESEDTRYIRYKSRRNLRNLIGLLQAIR
jgi:hypothetical protein